MAPRFDHLRPGDPVSRMQHAETWNAVLDATRAVRNGGITGTPGLGTKGIGSLSLFVENTTGGNLPIASIGALGVESYTIDVPNFGQQPCYKLKAPTGADGEVIVVLKGPLAGYVTGNAANGTGNGIGQAIVLGHAVANISVSNVSHPYARAESGDTDRLHSSATVGFPILGEVNSTGNLTLGVLLDRTGEAADDGQWVRITGNIGNGSAYPAVEVTPHAGNLGWTDGPTVYALGGNNEDLEVGRRYHGTRASGTLGNLTLYRVVAFPEGDGEGGPAPSGGGDCAPFAGLSGNSCVFATISPGTGDCANITASETGMEYAGDGVWESPDPLPFGPVGNGTLYFTPGNAASMGQPRAWIDLSGLTFLTLAGCSEGELRFKGGRPFCGDDGDGPGTVPCPPDQFTVSFTCDCCDPDYDGPGWYCVDGEEGPECVELTECPPGNAIISGPHEDEEACNEECTDIITSACCPGVEMPETFYLHITEATGVYACLLGKTYAMDYVPASYDGHWAWRGTDPCGPLSGDCFSNVAVTDADFICIGGEWEITFASNNFFYPLIGDCEELTWTMDEGSICDGDSPDGDGSYMSFEINTTP